MKTLAIVFFTLSAALSLLGQATSGMPSFNVYSRGTYDQVNVANRSVMITVRVRSKAGPIPFSYSLVANPNVMKGLGNTYQLDSKFYGNSSTMVGPGNGVAYGLNPQYTKCLDGVTPTTVYSIFFFYDVNHTFHNFPNTTVDTAHCLYPAQTTSTSSDNQGYTLNVSTATGAVVTHLYSRNGDQLNFSNYTDTNNNTISYSAKVFTWCRTF